MPLDHRRGKGTSLCGKRNPGLSLPGRGGGSVSCRQSHGGGLCLGVAVPSGREGSLVGQVRSCSFSSSHRLCTFFSNDQIQR